MEQPASQNNNETAVSQAMPCADTGASLPRKIDNWQKKLLDLSLRNRLLNIPRHSADIIFLACCDASTMEDSIAEGKQFSIDSLFDSELCANLSDEERQSLESSNYSEFPETLCQALEAEKNGAMLHARLHDADLQKKLKELYRRGRIDLEEGGVNTLFITIGTLEWRVDESRSLQAPLLLIPIKLSRKAVNGPYKIEKIGEDATVNITLLELLKREFHINTTGLETVQADEKGIDVAALMQSFQDVIKDMDGWSIRQTATCGLYSFSKFIMWNDMVRHEDELNQHPIIKHLIEGGGSFDDGIDVSDIHGNDINLAELFCPLSADSSQLTAVLYSGHGKSFVLHGPPGTGKSQTITNIIAHNITHGKRVLFVSEKKAALDVVHRRLSQIGLRPFCLELHSNKSGKKNVLAQFSEVLNLEDTQSPAEWDLTISRLNELRSNLNSFVKALHHIYPNGLSAYDCLARLSNDNQANSTELDIDCLSQNAEELVHTRTAIDSMAAQFPRTTTDAINAFMPLRETSWSPQYEKLLFSAIDLLNGKLMQLQDSLSDMAGILSIQNISVISAIEPFASLLSALPQTTDFPTEFISAEINRKYDFLKAYLANFARKLELQTLLGDFLPDKVCELNIPGIKQRIDDNRKKFFISRFFANHSLLNDVSSTRKKGSGKLTIEQLEGKLGNLEEFQQILDYLGKNSQVAEKLLGEAWNNGSPDTQNIQANLETVHQLHQSIQQLAELQKQDASEILNSIIIAVKSADTSKRIHDTLPQFITSRQEFNEALQSYEGYVSKMPTTLPDLQALLSQMNTRKNDLRNTMLYCKYRQDAMVSGCKDLIALFEKRDIAPELLIHEFDMAYYRTMLGQIQACTSELADFSAPLHENRLKEFAQLDEKYLKLTQQYIVSELTSRLPKRRHVSCPENTALGILRRECEKKGRQKPIKILLEQIKDLLPVLKPCFLMSPLSVAQYLPMDENIFDLVVFDEASQIPVWDAIGVIARGKQLIVVGDPKQMPPTNFFLKSMQNQDMPEEDDDEDMESILDECIAADVYPTYLNWHYRSRHEDLISFSNSHYYDNRLYTFPNAGGSRHMGIFLHKVNDAIYERKGRRINRKEATELVDYVFGILSDPEQNSKSIGIVTFSQAQQELIEDMLEERRVGNSEFEQFFSDSLPETLFVKNLENVQGDERDIIIFSICYGYDKDGTFAMNFGPLNKEGGERRLNVAVTRAKEQVVVFSSIDSSMIDLNRTQSIGAKHLKDFLEYAQSRQAGTKPDSQTEIKDELVDSIAEFLSENGYVVTKHLGCSKFKLDMAVSMPDNPDAYLAGIICDGNVYSSHKTARDRDHILESVLTSLGWNLMHMWSIDWQYNRTQACQELLNALQNIRNGQTAASEDVKQIEETAGPVPNAEPTQDKAKPHIYIPWRPTAYLSADDFATNPDRIKVQAEEIINQEGPIRCELLRKRLLKAWGISRPKQDVENIIQNIIAKHEHRTQDQRGPVLWHGNPDEFTGYRIPGNNPESKRTLEEIPDIEITHIFDKINEDLGACSAEALFKQTLLILGFNTLTEKSKAILNKILQNTQCEN